MSGLIQRRRARLVLAPALIVPRRILYYRGLWAGDAATAKGRWLVEGRAGALSWVDIRDLLDGEWDGQAATAMLAVTHLIGFGVGESYVVVPGSQTWTSDGTHVIAPYNRMEVAVWGGGGPGGSANTSSGQVSSGSAGNTSTYASPTSVIAAGGNPGTSADGTGGGNSGGSGGSAGSGGTGTNGVGGSSGSGGSGGAGGAGGSSTGTLLGTLTGGSGAGTNSTTDSNGTAGSAPGGGGSGGLDGSGSAINRAQAGGGGGGQLMLKLFAGPGDSGAPAFESTITTTVGGTRTGPSGGSGGRAGGTGARGEILAQWD